MTDIESLCRLTEAVEAAGADIAPTGSEMCIRDRS